MSTIALKRHLIPYVVADEALYLVSERAVTAVRGEIAAALAPLLDGSLATEQIVAELAGRYPARQVRNAIDALARDGRISHTTTRSDRQQAGYWELGGLDGDAAAARLATGCVKLETHGDVDVAPVRDALAAAGVRVAAAADEHALTVAVTDDYLRPTLAACNERALATATPWLLARPVGAVVWVGPLFRPGDSGCWACLTQRLSANQQARTYLQDRLGSGGPLTAATGLAMTAELGARLIALETARFLAGMPAGDAGVLTFDTLAMASEHHELIRRPQCPVCGDASLQAEQGRRPVTFASRRKLFTADGGHRSRSPEDVLATYGRHVSPITGVVTHLIPHLDGPPMLKVYSAGQNLARHVGDLQSLRTSLRGMSCGKGMSDTQARASAICEAIERYSGVFRGDEAQITASYSELGDDAVHPHSCLLYSEQQYDDQADWNSRGSHFNLVPDRFDEDARIAWSPVWSATAERTRWLPTSYLYFGHPRAAGTFPTPADSNGNAAGTSIEDAALQGFLELVERDSVAMWWYNRVRRPGIDLDSFAEPYICELRAAYASLGREIWALDLTSDFGIPAVAAFSRRTDRDVEDIVFAFGAHLDPRIALLRALTEMNQFLPAVMHSVGNGRDGYGMRDPEALRWWSTATLAGQPHLQPAADLPARTPASWTQLASDDLADDLAFVQRLVEERGMEMLVLDQTRPDIGLPVAKVIVPGMRHFWARLGQGRLYDVPVSLGWLPAALPEADMNPLGIFI
jgi:ribosomal protein S12 methylthiotransferase accessory factor